MPAIDPDADTTFELHIQLEHIKPPIWRTFIVPDDIVLTGLHHVIQVVMGWTNGHLHEFRMGAKRYAPPDPDGDDFGSKVHDEADYMLEELLKRPKQTIVYEYDFGDGWSHLITVKAVRPGLCHVPKVLAGARSCPPEDCGGIGGYENVVRVRSDPKDPEYKDMMAWLPDGYDPEVYTIAEVNKVLGKGIDELGAMLGGLDEWGDEDDIGEDDKIIDFPKPGQ